MQIGYETPIAQKTFVCYSADSLDKIPNKTPVIFIPGIGGSILAERNNDGTETHLFPDRAFTGIGLESLDVSLNKNIVATDAIRTIPIVGKNIYKTFIEDYLGEQGGYEEYNVAGIPERRNLSGCQSEQQRTNKPDLFVFAYDWRLSNSENTSKLHDYIQCVQKFYPGTDVNIVAHSMGGLLARRYLLDYSLNHHVSRMITIGSPFLGAPKAIDVLLTGRFLGTETLFGGVYLHTKKIKQLALYGKGMHELLPSDWYFDLGGRPFKEEFDINKNYIFPELYPTLPDLAEWIDINLPPSPIDGSVPYFNSRHFHSFPDFSSKSGQDDWREDLSGVDYYHIYGNKAGETDRTNGTIGAVVIESIKNRSETDIRERYNYGNEHIEGDGTVPLLSSTRDNGTLSLNFGESSLIPIIPSNSGENDKADHNGMMKSQDVFDEILPILEDSSALSSKKNKRLMNNLKRPNPPEKGSSLEERKIYWKKLREYSDDYSKQQKALGYPNEPENYYLDITGVGRVDITDSQGNTNTNLGNADLAVPGVYYQYGSEAGENLVVPHQLALPIDNTFDIKFRTSSDIIEVKIVKGKSEKKGSQAIKYLDMNLPVGVTAWLRFTPEGVMDLRYDADGDGIFESTLAPTYNITGDAAKDVTAPQIRLDADISGNAATVSITAFDEETGVKEIYYQIKDGSVPQLYTAPFTVDISQSKFITAYAEDNAGNRRSAIKQFDFTPPTSTVTLSPALPVGGWYNDAVTVNISASDDVGGAGVKEIIYSAEGAGQIPTTRIPVYRDPFAFPSPNTINDIANAQISIGDEGITTLNYSAKDSEGNAEITKYLDIKVDYTAPRSDASINVNGNTATINLSADDYKLVYNPNTEQYEPDLNLPVSGVNAVKYSIDGGEWQIYSAPISFSGNAGTHFISYYGIDNAGNTESENSKSFTLEAIATPKPVRPVLECVTQNGDGTYTAKFSYKNDNSSDITIPVGADNKFTPNPIDRGQIIVFQPGRHTFAFEVIFGGSNLVWTLKGPDGSRRTSTASSNSTRCE